jgi:hypothetical protein
MKLKGKIVLLFIGSAIAFAACKKKDNSTNTTPTKTPRENLTEGKWQLTSMPMEYTISGFGGQSWNQYDSMEACEKDNFSLFMTSGKVWADEGATKCNTSDPQIDSTGTWTLNTDNTKMTFSDMGSNAFEVQELTSTSLKLYLKVDSSYSAGGFPITVSSKTTMIFKNIK